MDNDVFDERAHQNHNMNFYGVSIIITNCVLCYTQISPLTRRRKKKKKKKKKKSIICGKIDEKVQL